MKNRIGLYYLVTAIIWYINYAYTPTFSPYLTSIGVSYAAIGMIGGAYGLAQFILRLPIGLLSDRLGKRKVFVVAGLVFGTVSACGLFFATHPALLWAFRFLSGVSASTWVIITVLFSSYFDERELTSRIAYLNIAYNSGIILGRLTGSMAADFWGYRVTFLLCAAVGVVGVVLSLFVVENTPKTLERPSIRSLLSVIKNRNLLVLSVLAIFAQICLFSTTNTFTPELAALLGASSMEIGILITVATIPSIIAATLCGWLFRKKMQLRALLAIAFLLQVIGTLMLPFAASMAAIYAASLVIGFGYGFCLTPLMCYCTLTVDPERRSVAMGFFQAMYGIGMFAGPVLVGAVANVAGLSVTLALSAVIPAIGCLLTLTLLRK